MNKNELISRLLKNRYAHRGLHEKPSVPENSMTAFRRSVAEGFGIELDIHLTGDGKLAVIHDSSLKRTTGIDLVIEEITLKEAQVYFLESSQEVIPEFEQVLKAVNGAVPLIVELKPSNKNCRKLCEAVANALERYEGDFCVESFDPIAVKWFRKNKQDWVRGQLAGPLKKDGFGESIKNFLLVNLWVNAISKPDFVAYKFESRNEEAFLNYKGAKVLWTIREYSQLKEAEAMGAAAIFEKFNPKDYL